jgi:hypothetical protein
VLFDAKNFILALFMYLNYFILFSIFFYTSYFFKKCGNKDGKEVPVDGTEEYYKLKAK